MSEIIIASFRPDVPFCCRGYMNKMKKKNEIILCLFTFCHIMLELRSCCCQLDGVCWNLKIKVQVTREYLRNHNLVLPFLLRFKPQVPVGQMWHVLCSCLRPSSYQCSCVDLNAVWLELSGVQFLCTHCGNNRERERTERKREKIRKYFFFSIK